jgi:hypothetical protein
VSSRPTPAGGALELPGEQGHPLAVGAQAGEGLGLGRGGRAPLLARQLPGQPILLDAGVEGGDRLLPDEDRPDVGDEGEAEEEQEGRDEADRRPGRRALARTAGGGPRSAERPDRGGDV